MSSLDYLQASTLTVIHCFESCYISENSQLSQDEFYEWIKDRLKSKSEMRDSLMQSLDILFPGTERVPIDDLLAKLSELGETFDETEAAYARMTLEEFDSNKDGAIDKSGNYSNDKLRNLVQIWRATLLPSISWKLWNTGHLNKYLINYSKKFCSMIMTIKTDNHSYKTLIKIERTLMRLWIVLNVNENSELYVRVVSNVYWSFNVYRMILTKLNDANFLEDLYLEWN